MRLPVVLLIVACVPLQALADAKVGEEKAQLCITCHKDSPSQGFMPTLEAQPADFPVAALMAYKTGRRTDMAMNTNARSLSPEDMRDIAQHFASRPLPALSLALDSGKVAAGEKLVAQMKCASCHTAAFHGAGVVPRLAGQKYGYLNWQMGLFRGGQRRHPDAAAVLTDLEDIAKVASYLASLR